MPKVYKSEYMNRSRLPQIDKIVESVYSVFQKFMTIIKVFRIESEPDIEERDKVGYLISKTDHDFIKSNSNERSNGDHTKFEEGKNKKSKQADKRDSLNVPITSSLQMTSTMSGSKVI